jgi:LysR family transcriptional regulator, hypochlorite-specific transcription factor HypT
LLTFHAPDEPLMNLTWLEDFLALAASGNFSRASQERHSSQPAFSRRIRSLEEWMGTDLFDRSHQPAELTDAGQWFVGIAEEMLARVAKLPGEARLIADANASTLRIASTHALSFTFLPRWLHDFGPASTVGQIQIMSDVLLRCEALMEQSKVQFVMSHAHAASIGVLDGEAYMSARVGDDVMVPVCRPDTRGAPIHRLDVAGSAPVPVLLYTEESGLGRILQAVLGRELERVPLHADFTAHAASVLRTMALDGRGLAWLPRTLVDDDLATGRLVAAARDEWSVPLEIRLYRGRGPMGSAAEGFWSALTGE